MLALSTIHGVIWSFLDELLRRGIGILVTLLLARFLVPEDFGLLAMMSVFIAITSAIMDSGIRQAVIRKLEPDDNYFTTAFITNIAFGVIAYIGLCACAPLISAFYDEPRLINLIRVAGLVVPINAFCVIQLAILSRALNFKLQMQASVPAAAISGVVAVVLAWLGMGVWALIIQTLLAALLTTLYLWHRQSWRPEGRFHLPSFQDMYSFGYKLLLAGLLDTISKNIYILVIAKLFTASIAGLYFFAERIKDLLTSQLVSAVQKVTYPAFSTLQTNPDQLKASYRKVLEVTTFILFPSMLFMAALAEPLFELLFPERWMPAVPYLQIMCITALMYPLHSINLNILKVTGRSDLFLGLEIYKKVTLFLILYASYRYGVTGILIGKGIQSVISYLPNSYYSSKLIGYRVTEQLKDTVPSLCIASAVSMVTFGLSKAWAPHPSIELATLSIFALVTYVALAKITRLRAYELVERNVIARILKCNKPSTV